MQLRSSSFFDGAAFHDALPATVKTCPHRCNGAARHREPAALSSFAMIPTRREGNGIIGRFTTSQRIKTSWPRASLAASSPRKAKSKPSTTLEILDMEVLVHPVVTDFNTTISVC